MRPKSHQISPAHIPARLRSTDATEGWAKPLPKNSQVKEMPELSEATAPRIRQQTHVDPIERFEPDQRYIYGELYKAIDSLDIKILLRAHEDHFSRSHKACWNLNTSLNERRGARGPLRKLCLQAMKQVQNRVTVRHFAAFASIMHHKAAHSVNGVQRTRMFDTSRRDTKQLRFK